LAGQHRNHRRAARVMPMQSRFVRNVPPGFAFLWLLLTFIWFASNSSTAIETLLTGALISAILAFLFASRTNVWQSLEISPARLYHFVIYLGVLVVEIVRANIGMLRHIYLPSLGVSPGIIAITTALKSPVGRLALVNSIALTPGSLVMDIRGATIFVHWLDIKTKDPEEARLLIAGRFEQLLEKVFD
jgi:multicomponent Na+:H+ antiporter subunit E